MPRMKPASAIPSPLAGDLPAAIAAASCLPRNQATGPTSGQQVRPRSPRTNAVTAWLLADCAGGGGGGRLATLIVDSLELVCVLADARDQHALAVVGLDDQEDAEDQEQGPEEPEHAAGERDDVADDRDHDPEQELGDGEHQAVLGVPLHFRVVLLDHEGDEGE